MDNNHIKSISEAIRNEKPVKIIRNAAGDFIQALERSERLHFKTKDLVRGFDKTLAKRDMTVSNTGELVPTQIFKSFKQSIYFDGLLAKLNVSVSDIDFSTQNSVATVSKIATEWLAEDEPISQTLASITRADFESHTVGGGVEISRKLAKQVIDPVTGEQAESVIRRTIANSIREEVARVLFNGTGLSNQPLGILNHSGVFEIDATSSIDDGVTEFADAIKRYEDAGLNPDNCKILVGTDVKKAATIAYENGTRWKQNGVYQRMIGTPLMPSGTALIGDFTEDNLEILASDRIDLILFKGESPNDKRDLYGFHDVDIAITRPQAFVKITNL